MREKSSPKSANPHTVKRSKAGAIRRLLVAEGRSWAWLSRQTGYSDEHLRRVDSGDHDGTPKFWIAVRSVLGDRLETRVA